MDYIYENLGDERFQEFCSTLVSKEFPNIQCLPVGQPDGGRDSLVYYMDSPQKEFIIFQVKYTRNYHQEKDAFSWLEETISKEIEKINKLIPRGAKAYYLLTNVKGSAHLDNGTKDKLNKFLEENIKIPSLCWWRDDISRLFEKDPLFKWSFPEILNGQDILNQVLFDGLQENKERRENVVIAYLTDQYEIDNEVKFKQIDLQNRLLNLFTDVPIRIKKFNEKNNLLRRTLGSFEGFQRRLIRTDYNIIEEKETIGAAAFLLDREVQKNIGKILLEGGPGQGKSTISQYVCQVHRVRLLNKILDLNFLPDNIRNTPIRLPFKIDLRDIAGWVEKENPYPNILTQEYFDNNWRNSLESFLIAHIFYHSKLEEFTSTDFIAICKLSPILFVFDGFDEIANIKVRGEVIEFINKGITRISANAKSVQVIITSRPAAFTDSIGFSIDNYPHFELTDITANIINEYLEKWIKASKLDSRDASELRKLVKDKLEMPHLKDLAKSPMQLAIFISLLRTKGQSLPNKRTALYDSYINLFFDRESEKNTLIRDQRDLIIDIHQYLAWVLHSEAELYKKSGSISIEDLSRKLKEYLSRDGHDTSIADQLFNVMKERVCALVSRVQGTFEFEVQPLREYFCAKYLYRSAPHSSAGSVKTGTKPERLNAILRNFYWQNVVRFFTGCADAGELDMIIQELKDLQNDELLKYTNYPRVITSQILSDYVFAQKPLKLKEVVKIIIDGINIGNVLNQDGRISSNQPLLLPVECGGAEVVYECFQQLSNFPNNDYAAELIGILNNNSLGIQECWLSYLPSFQGIKLTKWLEYAYKLQMIHKIEDIVLLEMLNVNGNDQVATRLQILANGGRLQITDQNIELKHSTLNYILNRELSVFPRPYPQHSFQFLGLLMHPNLWSSVLLGDNQNFSFLDYLNNFAERNANRKTTSEVLWEFKIQDGVDKMISEFASQIVGNLNVPLSEFKKSIGPWDFIIENSRRLFKENWSQFIIATVAAGIKSKEERYDEFSDMNDESVSLCKRVRCARLKSGNAKYWETQISSSKNVKFSLLVFFTWATPKTIVELLPMLCERLGSMDSIDFLALARGLRQTARITMFDKVQEKFIEKEISGNKKYDTIKYLLSLRIGGSQGQKFIYENIESNSNILQDTIKSKFEYLLIQYLQKPGDLALLKEVKKLYKSVQHYDHLNYFRRYQRSVAVMPYDIAKMVMIDCKDYPRIVSSFAEKACIGYATKHTKAIGEIANEMRWFEN